MEEISYKNISIRLAAVLDAVINGHPHVEEATAVLADYYELHNKEFTITSYFDADAYPDEYGFQPYIKDEEYANESDKLNG
jgi:hypothetical protein